MRRCLCAAAAAVALAPAVALEGRVKNAVETDGKVVGVTDSSGGTSWEGWGARWASKVLDNVWGPSWDMPTEYVEINKDAPDQLRLNEAKPLGTTGDGSCFFEAMVGLLEALGFTLPKTLSNMAEKKRFMRELAAARMKELSGALDGDDLKVAAYLKQVHEMTSESMSDRAKELLEGAEADEAEAIAIASWFRVGVEVYSPNLEEDGEHVLIKISRGHSLKKLHVTVTIPHIPHDMGTIWLFHGDYGGG